MSHTPNIPDSAGEFTATATGTDNGIVCRHCKQSGNVTEREWESSCGGYEDYRYDCAACGKGWWVEGIDS